MSTILHQESLIKISGIEAKVFLQGQLTCDMESLSFANSRLAAHCNPQGRVISLFTLFLQQQDYYLLMPATMIPIAMSALKKYAIFYKVTMESISIESSPLASNMLTAYKPTIYPDTSGKFLPHELNLHLLDAISFDKGCYTGQEIIARMQYRGKLKKHTYRAKINCLSAPPPCADVYYESDNKIDIGGTILDSTQLNPHHHERLIWLVCDESEMKNNHLFINEQNHRAYITFID